MKKGINTLEEILIKNQWADAIISISHKLYGLQKIKCRLDCILDDQRIGFKVKDENEIYIYRGDLVDYGIKDGIYFADDIMEINIKLNRAV